MKPRTVIESLCDMDLSEIKKFEFIYNTQKTRIDEFEGKVREIPIEQNLNNNTESLSRKMAFGKILYKII